MKNFELGSLVLEITRKCNMECEHCCRRDQEYVNLDMSYVEYLFEKIKYISTLTISGGEPSLNPSGIINVLNLAKKHEVVISNFYIATNAYEIKTDFLFACLELWEYCDSNELSLLNISNDEFHDRDAKSIKKLSAFSFMKPKYDDSCPTGSHKYLINEGRSKDFGIGKRDIRNARISYEELDDCFLIEEDNIYLNCAGDLINGCDFSYRSQGMEENIICTAKEFSIEKIDEYNNKYFSEEKDYDN